MLRGRAASRLVVECCPFKCTNSIRPSRRAYEIVGQRVVPRSPPPHLHPALSFHVFSVRELSSMSVHSKSASVFSGWSQTNDWHQDAFLADATLQEKEAWLESRVKSQDKSLDVGHFLLVLNALAKSPEAGAPRRAENWLIRMKQSTNLEPTEDVYKAVIQAWANSNKEQPVVIVNRAEKWLNEFLEQCATNSNSSTMVPTIGIYNAFLDACTRGRSGSNKKNQWIVNNNAQKADDLLRRLHSEYHHHGNDATIIPNTESFNYVLRGWTRCKHDLSIPSKALRILRLMESYQQNDPIHTTVKPDSKSYCMVIDAIVNCAKLKALRSIEAGRFSSDPTINGMNEMIEAANMVQYMHDLYDAGGKDVVPHAVAYNILLTGWAGMSSGRHHQAPFKAEEILRRMFTHRDNGFMEAAPDRISFEKVMLAWANSDHSNAGRRARWWLKKLWNEAELLGDEGLLPTTQTYNIVMRALGKSEGALAAENLLLDLGDKYREAPTSSLCPNSESFSIVVHAWLDKAYKDEHIEDRIHSLKRGAEWLASLRQVENEHNLSTAPELFIRVLQTAKLCAWQRPDILELASNTFADLQQSRHRVDAASYVFLLEVGLAALSSEEANEARHAFLDGIVHSCCEHGFLGGRFVRALVNSRVDTAGWTLEELEETRDRMLTTWPPPAAWTRNLHRAGRATEKDFIRQNGPRRQRIHQKDHSSCQQQH